MMVSQPGDNGARVRLCHEWGAHDRGRGRVKTDAKVAKEHETRRMHAQEISVLEVSGDKNFSLSFVFWS